MRYLITLILSACVVLLTATGCQNSNKEYGPGTVIRGKIRYPLAGTIYLYAYPNDAARYISRKSVMDSVQVDRDGFYQFTLPRKSPEIFDLKNGDSTLVSDFFIRPEDKLTINFNDHDAAPEIVQDGEAARYNEFRRRYINAFFKNPDTIITYYIRTNYMDLSHFILYNNSRLQSQLDFYTAFCKDHPLPKLYSDQALSDIHYQIGADRLMYVWKKRMKGEIRKVDPTFYNYFTASYLENPDAFYSQAYIHMLNAYIDELYMSMVQDEFPGDGKKPPLIPVVEKFKLATQHLSGIPQNIVVYNLIYSEARKQRDPAILQDFTDTGLDSLLRWLSRKYPDLPEMER